MDENHKEETFSAKAFVERLKAEGSKVRCDDTNDSFDDNFKLPPFYDEKKLIRARNFYHENIFAMFFAKILGLITDLAMPSAYKVLMFTNMSTDPMSAYKRYFETILHMNVWYDIDLKPNSKSWKSIRRVRLMHNSASRRCDAAGIANISQMQMAIAQFGFMGYAVASSGRVGIHGPRDEDLEALVHFWKVIGHLMGVEERFNICRDSLEETRRICDEIIGQILGPAVARKDPHFIGLTAALIRGMWVMVPVLEMNVWLKFVFELTRQSENAFKLNVFESFLYHYVCLVMYMLRYRPVRVFMQYAMYLILRTMMVFPFLAYYKFGASNAYVNILNSR